MRCRNAFAFVFGVCAAGLLAGCSAGGPAPATVAGQVTVNGEPVAGGVISFAPADGPGDPASGAITNGRYEVRTTAGKKLVMISAPVVTGKRKDSPSPEAGWVEVTRESIPAKYNSQSELRLDVAAGGNTKDWPLEVKK